jgi:hypothetical protein
MKWSWVVLSGSMVLYFETLVAKLVKHHWYLPHQAMYLIWLPLVLVWLVEYLVQTDPKRKDC